ncbi:MAG: hypothetical protein MZV64_25110 [Ignavibacteriales bacterium]|nr:hypothetical protein [Ignavibacteriales bacterium]
MTISTVSETATSNRKERAPGRGLVRAVSWPAPPLSPLPFIPAGWSAGNRVRSGPWKAC